MTEINTDNKCWGWGKQKRKGKENTGEIKRGKEENMKDNEKRVNRKITVKERVNVDSKRAFKKLKYRL